MLAAQIQEGPLQTWGHQAMVSTGVQGPTHSPSFRIGGHLLGNSAALSTLRPGLIPPLSSEMPEASVIGIACLEPSNPMTWPSPWQP